MKKVWLFLMLLAILAIVALFVIILQKPSEDILTDGGTISALKCASLPEVVVIYREGCPACAVAVPRLKQIEQELGKQFKYYDLAITSDAQEVKDKGLIAQFVPTVIIKCKVYVGVRTIEQYKTAITG